MLTTACIMLTTACIMPPLNPPTPLPHPPTRYLDYVRLYCVGCSSAELSDLKVACCDSGASQEPNLHPRINHIVVRGV